MEIDTVEPVEMVRCLTCDEIFAKDTASDHHDSNHGLKRNMLGDNFLYEILFGCGGDMPGAIWLILLLVTVGIAVVLVD